ncbi:response regulator [Actinomadura scrupuli]|uniref:response regulator n=1 Tax=Actinomadura scrupuli TaxID=559629 RepID=UPI003D95F1BE
MALRCLIVDDNHHFRVAARDLLEREGIAVVGMASTTAQALHLVGDLRPDVALVDVELGEESGFDLAWRLDGAGYAERTSVILISVHAEMDFADLTEASPAVAFLPKSDISGRAINNILGRTGPTGIPGRR